MRDKVDRKQEELARLAKVAEADFLAPSRQTGWRARPLPVSIPPAGSTQARTSGNRRAGTRTNEPRAGQERRREPAPQLNGNTPPGEATRKWREGRKGAATVGLFMQVPKVNERKNSAGGRKERPGRRP